ncbi:MAG: hypothetical protein ACYTG6_12070, partial [Planctomycetota bacterium]
EAREGATQAASALARAQQAMEQAARAASSGDAGRTSDAQQRAEEALREAEEGLEQAASETGAPGEDNRERLNELREEQERIREKLKELQDLLEKADSEEAQSASRSANQSMEETENQLQSGSGERASESAEEAREYLEQMREELERERRRYETLQQEELLFQLVQDLKRYRDAEVVIRQTTADISEAAERAGRLSRPLKRQLKDLAGEQEEIAVKIDERLEAVREEGSIAFSAVMEDVSLDMHEISRLLGGQETGPLVLGLEDEVIRRLEDLVGGFEDEIERRRNPPQQGQPQNGGPPPLVPPIVEVKLIRRLQQDLNLKVETFWRRNPSVQEGKLTEAQRRTLERLYHQQGRLSRVLEELKRAVFGE